MSRRSLIASGVAALAVGGAGLSYVGYEWATRGAPPPPPPPFVDKGETLSSQQQFDKLAATDPVKMLSECLTRYQREVKSVQCVIRKQERIGGSPKPPEAPPIEEIAACVRGDVPDAEGKTMIEVMLKWTSGAKSPLGIGAKIEGTLFSERPAPEGLGGKVMTYRPGAWGGDTTAMDPTTPPARKLAQSQSRYSVRDAGLYRSMLRTHAAWKARQDAGELKFEYLGKRTPEFIGRECHVIKRVCPRVEIDAFEIGGTASTDPKVVASEGFTEVTIFVDAERWLQVGTELYRTEPDGTRVLVGAYAFRDVQLNPDLPPDTFTPAGMKK